LGEIFPRKGQDIFFFWQSTEKWYEKFEAKLLESNYNILVRKMFFPKLSKGGGGVLLLSEKIFEIGAPKKNLPRAPAKLSAALIKSSVI
jgi:hypothetical protein